MFIRVVTGVYKHLPDRWLEWLCAGNIAWYGYKLTAPGVQWSNAEAWSFMLSTGLTETGWGWLCLLIGLLRILALIVNGTFAGTWYSEVSPWVRALTAAGGATFWFMVYLSVSNANSSGSAIYQLPLILDLYCSLRVVFLIGRTSVRNPPRHVGIS